MSECCASGSCEVCRAPRGYSPSQRRRFEQIQREWDEATKRERPDAVTDKYRRLR